MEENLIIKAIIECGLIDKYTLVVSDNLEAYHKDDTKTILGDHLSEDKILGWINHFSRRIKIEDSDKEKIKDFGKPFYNELNQSVLKEILDRKMAKTETGYRLLNITK